MNPASIIEERARFTDLIIKSRANRKLIVAGPGTGKTYTFKQALAAAGGRGLALTFINNLARELETELIDVADSNTFHGFCKFLLHRTSDEGLTTDFDYYPPLPLLVARDLEISEQVQFTDEELTRCFRKLNGDKELISKALRIAAYYNAVGHDDAVYRVFQHLKINPSCVPKFPLVVVDEYQDFNPLETGFIELLAQVSPVLIAGDDDQALYGFKDASPTYIRDLAQDDHYERFALPYCSRCTEIIVAAVHDVVKQAETLGLLAGRLSKDYLYYPPEKEEDSLLHPRIIHARCTVERNASPYIGRYVAQSIAKIPEHEIRESRDKRYPTVLVTGPIEFVTRVHEILATCFQDVILKKSSAPQVVILDGYRRLHRFPASRLGWRIVMHCDVRFCEREIIETALNKEKELVDLIPSEYREWHLQMARLVGRIETGESLVEEEKRSLSDAVGDSFEDIEKALLKDEEKPTSNEQASPVPADGPSVICTSILGAKGLSASRVFIVGFNNGHFPRNPDAITEDEIRSLLVALSRARKQCCLVSCGRFGNSKLQPSVFSQWIRNRVSAEWINKAWMVAHNES